MTISVIIPTLGRDTLAAALYSVLPQLESEDEVVVVADLAGDGHTARAICNGMPQVVYAEAASTVGIGCAQREVGIDLAKGDWLAFLDDDDVYLPGALEAFRNGSGTSGSNPERPVIFRMNHPLLGVLWREPVLVYGNVSSQMLLVPNQPDRLGNWEPYLSDGTGSDFTFITGCVERMGAPVWRDEIVAELSPAGVASGSRVMGAPA